MEEKPEFVVRFDVVEGMKWRIQSALAEDPAQSWGAVRERVKGDFAAKSRVLYNEAKCQYPDGSDLLAEVVERIVPQIRDETARKMEVAIESALGDGNSPTAEWMEVKADIQKANRLALGILASVGESDPLPEIVQSQASRIRSDTVRKMRDALVAALGDGNSPTAEWTEVKADIQKANRLALGILSSVGENDPLPEVVRNQVPQARSETVRKMRRALVAAVENAPMNKEVWSKARQDIIGKNSAAIGMLAQHSQSAPDGDALLKEALQELSGRVCLVDAPEVAPNAKFLTNQCPEPSPPPRPQRLKWVRSVLPPWIWLKWLHIVLTTLAAVATLIGVTVWDILPIPIPCDLPIFSLLPRC